MPAAGETVERLRHDWLDFGEHECGTYSPLYATICRSIAADPEVLALAAAAPPTGQQPNVLLAAVHYLLLGGIAHPLGDVYAAGTDAEQAPALFRDMCLSHQAAIAELLATRHTQTNEPGRSALLAIGLAATGFGDEPIGLLDAGCSAGLNLLIDRYRLDYGPMGALGPVDSPVTIDCDLSGATQALTRLAGITARLGLDRAPIDLTNADDARWLLACVWPDTGRLARTASAIELARQRPPAVMAGDMVTDLDAALDTFDPSQPIVVVTTSSYGYLSSEARRAFLAILTRRARDRRLAWLSVDGPGTVDVVPVPNSRRDMGSRAAVLGLVTFDGGSATGRALGLCHPHGSWLDWTA